MAERFYQNPIILGDYSDPDVVRVGNDFFMVSSSFNHMPALPVLHSTDLVNWTIINHVFQSFPMEGYDVVRPGAGVWAPSIRWHDKKLWVYFSTPDEGIFMSNTSDPWGAWSELHCVRKVRGWIDPCPFWDDDGSAWLVNAFAYSRCGVKHQLQLHQMTADGRELTGEAHIIYDGHSDLPTLEGPKIYKRKDWYYIFAPAGGVENGWQSVLRAQSMTGPWQARNVLFQGTTAVNGPHQGGWVEGEQGQCWFIHFQDLHLYGRVVHLQPMYWGEDNWPYIGTPLNDTGGGQPVLRWPYPGGLPHSGQHRIQTSDTFVGGKPGLQWQWQANPQSAWVIQRDEGLQLRCMPVPVVEGQRTLYHIPHLLLQKFPALTFRVHTTACLQAGQPGDAGGIIIFGERYAALVLESQEKGFQLAFIQGWVSDTGKKEEYRLILASLQTSACQLRVDVTEGGICRFYWREGDENWLPCHTNFAAGKGKWVGAKFGVFALTTAFSPGGTCLFPEVEVSDNRPPSGHDGLRPGSQARFS